MSTKSHKDHNRTCVACRTPIEAHASICAECGAYQKRWRNELKYWSSTAALGTTIIAALVFLVSTTPAALKAVYPHAAPKILYFESDDSLVLINHGNDTAYVTNVAMMTNAGNPAVAFDLSIDAAIPPDGLHRWTSSMKGKRGTESLIFFIGKTKEDFDLNIRAALKDTNCFRFSFHDDASLDRMRVVLDKSLNIVPAHGAIFYRSAAGSKVIEQSFKAHMLLALIDDRGVCTKKYNADKIPPSSTINKAWDHDPTKALKN